MRFLGCTAPDLALVSFLLVLADMVVVVDVAVVGRPCVWSLGLLLVVALVAVAAGG